MVRQTFFRRHSIVARGFFWSAALLVSQAAVADVPWFRHYRNCQEAIEDLIPTGNMQKGERNFDAVVGTNEVRGELRAGIWSFINEKPYFIPDVQFSEGSDLARTGTYRVQTQEGVYFVRFEKAAIGPRYTTYVSRKSTESLVKSLRADIGYEPPLKEALEDHLLSLVGKMEPIVPRTSNLGCTDKNMKEYGGESRDTCDNGEFAFRRAKKINEQAWAALRICGVELQKVAPSPNELLDLIRKKLIEMRMPLPPQGTSRIEI